MYKVIVKVKLKKNKLITMSIRIIIYNVEFHISFFKSNQIRNTQVVFLWFREISNGPISSKFPIPVDDCPGPPYKIIHGISLIKSY